MVSKMDSSFPTRETFVHVIEPPFAVEYNGEWLAVGIDNRLGLVVQFRDDPSVLRWLGQVVKFMPRATYLSPVGFESELAERGLAGVEWRIGSDFSGS